MPYHVVVDGNFDVFLYFAVLKDDLSTGLIKVPAADCRDVLGFPGSFQLTVGAVHSLHGYPGRATAFLKQEAWLFELDRTRVWKAQWSSVTYLMKR